MQVYVSFGDIVILKTIVRGLDGGKSVNQKEDKEQQGSWRKLILRHGIVKRPVQIHFHFSKNCVKY